MTARQPLALTLIAAEAARPALPTILLNLEEDFAGGETRWLSEGEAADFLVEAELANLDKRARLAIGSAPIDFAVQRQEGRRKRILVADMESTLIEQELLDELAGRVGLRAEIAEITRQSMAGEIDFEGSLYARVEKLKGVPEQTLSELAAEMTFFPGARQLFATMKAQKAVTAVVTGGFSYFGEMIKQALGAEELFSNHLLIEDGEITGEVGEPILGPSGKLESLEEIARRLGLPLSAALAVGDGANDVEMLTAAGLGVAFKGKPPARAAADAEVNHTSLESLLFFQGLSRADFALQE